MPKSKQTDLESYLSDEPAPHEAWLEPAATASPVALNDFLKNNGLDAAATRTITEGPSMTRQEFAADCDINNLMERYQNQDIGAIMRASQEPVYVDFADMPSDLMSTLQLAHEAENAFMTLPAAVRREFDNDAVRFVDFASDPTNLDQMRNWGLAPPAPVPPAAPTPPAAPSPAAPAAPAQSLP